MTYFALVDMLDKMITQPLSDEIIKSLNDADISLTSNRYYRFLAQVNYLIVERIKLFEAKITHVIYERSINKEELILELDGLNGEVNYLNKIIDVKLIKNENKNDLRNRVIENNNALVNNLKELFESDEYLEILDNYLIKENL